jgi:3D-(3,5/4)-trihydroxycyclohexane-1,2-dione acylhydrolase (decyclizing)
MPRLTVAAALVQFLKVQYVVRNDSRGRYDSDCEHRIIHGVFGIFGHGNVTGLGQALEEFGGTDLPFLQPKNEQGMVHSAIAFAKTRKRLGTYACTTSVGPGATNLITGAATATINRLPVLLLPGDIFSNRVSSPVLQQLEHPLSMDISVNDCLKPVSRYWDRIHRPEQLLKALPEAMRVLTDPAETGAVTLCLPEDVQTEAWDFPASFFEKRIYRIRRPVCCDDEISPALHWIREARRPLIIAGGGVHYSDASEELQSLSSLTGIPVTVTQAGKGCLRESDPTCLGAIGVTGTSAANQAAQEADLVIAVGTRMSDFTTASQTLFQNKKVKFLNLNIHPMDAHKNRGMALTGDCRKLLTRLENGLRGEADFSGYHIPKDYQSRLRELRSEWEKEYQKTVRPAESSSEGLLYQSEIIRIVNETIPANGTIVHAAGGLPGDLHKLWRCKSNADYHSEYGYSCMGYEVAGALGVKLADPTREVFAFLGDGSYLMLNQEIVTSIQEQIKINILLVDNHGYQCIRRLQTHSGSKSFGNEFRSRSSSSQRLEGEVLKIDFLANAQSLGLKTYLANTAESLQLAIREATQHSTSTLIYIPSAVASNVQGYAWWDVPVAETSEQESVKTARIHYLKAKERQRLH